MASDMISIWKAQIRHYEGVKDKFSERHAEFAAEVKKWTDRLQQLIQDHEEADVRIAELHAKIWRAEEEERQTQAYSSASPHRGSRPKESKVQRFRRLQAELSKLQAEMGLD